MKMRKSIMAAITLFAVGALALTGCASGGGSADSDEYTIGFVVQNMADPDLAAMTAAMEEQATAEGATLVIADAKKDTAAELTQVEDLVSQQVDAIIMQPLDGEASQKAANVAIDAGIPLFILSTEFADGSDVAYESYIGVDDTVAGEMQAEYLNELFPEGGKIAFAAGEYGASWTDRRKTGFDNKINDNFTVVTEFQAKGSRDEGKRNMEDALQAFGPGQLDIVVANNDEMAIGAASAIADAGRASEFKAVVGVDGTPPAVAAILAGEMTATVRQESAAQGQKAVEVVVAFLSGESIEKRYTLPFTLINSDNAKDFPSE